MFYHSKCYVFFLIYHTVTDELVINPRECICDHPPRPRPRPPTRGRPRTALSTFMVSASNAPVASTSLADKLGGPV